MCTHIHAQALDNVPLLFYILALKTLLLCLGFAGVKIYQSKKAEAALKKQQAEKSRLAQQTQELIDNLKEDWRVEGEEQKLLYTRKRW